MKEIIDYETLNTHLAEFSAIPDKLLHHIREHAYTEDLTELEYIAEHIDYYFGIPITDPLHTGDAPEATSSEEHSHCHVMGYPHTHAEGYHEYDYDKDERIDETEAKMTEAGEFDYEGEK